MVLEHEIFLSPKYFGPKLDESIKLKLFSDVEGTCSGKYGFIIAVTNIERIGDGLLPPNRGFVHFPIVYRAIVFRPFKGEVLDAIVKNVNKVGVFAEAGPLTIFVLHHSVPPNIKFEGVDENVDNLDDDDENNDFAVGTLMDDYLGPVM